MAKYIKKQSWNEANHRMEYTREPNINHYTKGRPNEAARQQVMRTTVIP